MMNSSTFESEFRNEYQPSLMGGQLVITTIAILLNSVLLTAIYRNGRSPDYVFNANILLVDLLLALLLFIIAAGSLIQNTPILVTEPGMCVAFLLIYDGSQYSIAFCYMAIAIVNWKTIVYRQLEQSYQCILAWLAFTWAATLSIVITMVIMYPPHAIGNGLLCFPFSHHFRYIGNSTYDPSNTTHTWQSFTQPRQNFRSNSSRVFGNETMNGGRGSFMGKGFRRNPFFLMSFCLLIVTPIVVVAAYTHIYMVIRSIDKKLQASFSASEVLDDDTNAKPQKYTHRLDHHQHGLSSNEQPSSTSGSPIIQPRAKRVNSKLANAMRTLAMRGFITTIAFIALWALSMCIKLLMRHQNAIPRTDLLKLGHFLYITTTVVNPIVFIVCDYRLSRSLLELWTKIFSLKKDLPSLPAHYPPSRQPGVEFPIEATSDVYYRNEHF
ncbi:hypothetical protein QVD99_000849 [Batrachochytrium dendrobatidis]|nr:hypothetical protein O5D80_003698 [Batrachochytrium dendrobatidis]KAK5673400.1 hypothetical protein QVD99_000849 [Batrachochytrium dendrobatidis]